MLLGNLLKSTKKNYQNISIKGISFDSRKIKKGDIFFSVIGTKTPVIKFIDEAILKGASVVIGNKKVKYKNHNTRRRIPGDLLNRSRICNI